MAVPATREPESKNYVAQAKDFFEESVAELKKVTWPDYPQLRSATGVVLMFVIALSLVIFLMDLTIRKVIEIIMGIFGA